MEHLDTHLANLEVEIERTDRCYQEDLGSTLARADGPAVPLGSVLRLSIQRVDVVEGHSYPTAGVLNQGQGLIHRDPVSLATTNYGTLHRLSSGQMVMRKLTAWEGPIALVPREFDGSYVSPEFPTFTIDTASAHPEFLGHMCRWPGLWHQMRQRVTGSVQRRKRLSPDQLLSVEIPLPQLPEQAKCGERLSAWMHTRQSLVHEFNSLSIVRARSLTALLNREAAIPTSYDSLLAVS